MTSNIRQFEANVRKLARTLTVEQFNLFNRKICFESLRRAVLHTPVDTGVTRGAWQVTVNELPKGSDSKDRSVSGSSSTSDKDGADTINRGNAVIATMPPYSLLWITNSTPHIMVLEEGLFDPPNPGPSSDPRPGRFGEVLVSGGFSLQAPQGMVGLTLIELQAIFGP